MGTRPRWNASSGGRLRRACCRYPRAIEYRMLGPVEVWDGHQAVALGGPKPRTLLAVLLAHANEVVSMDSLVDELWGDNPPATARNMIHGYVAGLRARLGRDALRTEQGAYLLRVAPGELDVHRFEALVAEAEGQLAAGAPESARDLLCEALAL